MKVTDGGMRALRSLATLVDVLPRARVQIADSRGVLLTVSRPKSPQMEDGLVVSPCSFRAAVGHAYHQMSCHGAQFRFLDLSDSAEPSIHVGLPVGDQVLPGFIYRVRAANDGHLFLFMTDLTPSQCRDAVADAMTTVPEPDASGLCRRVGFHRDELTDLTVVHTLATQQNRQSTAALMERLLGTCVAAEMVSDIQRVSPPSQGTSK